MFHSFFSKKVSIKLKNIFSRLCKNRTDDSATSRAVVKPSNLSIYDEPEGLKNIVRSFDWTQHVESTSHLVKENGRPLCPLCEEEEDTSLQF